MNFSYFRTIAKLFILNVANAGSVFLMNLVVANVLGPEKYADYAVLLSIASITAIVADFGFSIAIVRTYKNEKFDIVSLQNSYGFVALKIAVLCIVCVPISWLLRIAFPVYSSLALYGALVSGLIISSWSAIVSYYQAIEELSGLGKLYVFLAVSRVFISLLLFARVVAIASAVLMLVVGYAIPFSIALVVFLLRTKPSLVNWTLEAKNIVAKTLKYSWVIGLSAILYNLLSRMPQFSLAKHGVRNDIAMYSFALSLLSVFSMANDSIRIILLPKAASCRTESSIKEYRRKMIPNAFLSVLALSLITAVFAIFIEFIFDSRYRNALPIFIILSVGMIITIIAGQFTILIHAKGVAHYDLLVNMIRITTLFLALRELGGDLLSSAMAYSGILACGEIVSALMLRRKKL